MTIEELKMSSDDQNLYDTRRTIEHHAINLVTDLYPGVKIFASEAWIIKSEGTTPEEYFKNPDLRNPPFMPGDKIWWSPDFGVPKSDLWMVRKPLTVAYCSPTVTVPPSWIIEVEETDQYVVLDCDCEKARVCKE